MSNSAPLMELVAMNMALHDSIEKALLALPQTTMETKLLNTAHPELIAGTAPEAYLTVIAPWHERGIPTFDMYMPQNLQWEGYFLLSLPSPTLHLSMLPLELQRELSLLRLDIDVVTDHVIPYSGE
jgi:phosphoribosyl-dephospho-CoA transferase